MDGVDEIIPLIQPLLPQLQHRPTDHSKRIRGGFERNCRFRLIPSDHLLTLSIPMFNIVELADCSESGDEPSCLRSFPLHLILPLQQPWKEVLHDEVPNS